LLLEDDAAVRVESGRALESRTPRATTLVASDGRVNVPNERGSIESDEETFIASARTESTPCRSDVLKELERPTIRVGWCRWDS